ncbi:putative protein [Arabidopsis thaliana]|uniref:Mediator of RNA polymerase II transcription subunit 20b n=2 Tax=Arabidopsis thaliana TaxID=3702 RepID=MD20B_ARATH|nr:TATA-binding related factor (TRF) of subunit 20 of Mediator complex [Arabidopsis thaliana]Q9M0S0.1 RecName: Full=Mediator of RNA polymerase II transcription subunit 20b [Arabidopsis thaliana]AEE82719.1 TATA-binding related factor (TRF) of subunit 20 of Mediator complex [Arabidopsis thaliana]CAA0394251.1 unnamed protein product [Arabidopsis thaliana]CAB78031.1 putative protein [Arabidopsis thaliana]VYS62075.1 unnamed protein product [Arabidopsis thaliana]|eukprot:NP_192646.1 TATA-binding related factor (TRF) of subunit 20 of Mediator complex [Arabidopsis thaliana]
MPVKWLLHWQPNQGSTFSSQILNEVTQSIESLNGVKEGTWKATLNYYKPMLQDQANQAEFPREFVGISLPEEPDKYYFVIRSQRIVVEADSSIQMIMESLQSYKCKLSFYFEGLEYQLGDFRLRVGKVVPTHAETIRGVVMEVEYLPISSMGMAKKLMEEFLEIWQEAMSKRSLPGKFVNKELNFEKFGLGDNYTPQHTAVGYAFFMANLMAAIQAGRG